MAQVMPLPLTVSCFSKIQIGFTFLVPAHLGNPGQRVVKWVCVCVCDTKLLFLAESIIPHKSTTYLHSFIIIIIIIITIVALQVRAVTSLHHPVHSRQHTSRGLQWDGWNRCSWSSHLFCGLPGGRRYVRSGWLSDVFGFTFTLQCYKKTTNKK